MLSRSRAEATAPRPSRRCGLRLVVKSPGEGTDGRRPAALSFQEPNQVRSIGGQSQAQSYNPIGTISPHGEDESGNWHTHVFVASCAQLEQTALNDLLISNELKRDIFVRNIVCFFNQDSSTGG